MTRPKQSRSPVSSFGPELMEVLLRGAREEVRIPCPNARFMMNLQMRIQMLRGAMAREKHPQYTLATRARTSRSWDKTRGPDADCVLIVRPNDSQFAAVLKAAGIVPTDAAQDLLEATAAPEIPRDPSTEPTPPSDEPPLSPYDRFKL